MMKIDITRDFEHSRKIIIAITLILSCISIFACVNAIPILRNAQEINMRNKFSGKSQYIVYSKEDYFSTNDIVSKAKVLGFQKNNAILNNKYKSFAIGIDIKEFTNLHDIEFESSYFEQSDVGLVISNTFAREIGVSVKDKVIFDLNGNVETLTVSAIAKNVGYFKANPQNIIVPIKKTSSMLGLSEDMASYAYIYDYGKPIPFDSVKIKDHLVIRPSVDMDAINSSIFMYQIFFIILFVFILLIDYFILSGIYKIYITKKATDIGTLRSVGASKNTIKGIFLTNSVKFGLIISFVGCVISATLLVIYSSINPDYKIFNNKAELFISIITCIVFVFFISCLSVLIPINSILKTSEQSLISGITAQNNKEKNAHGLIWILIFLLVMTISIFVKFNNNIVATVILLVTFVLIVPKFISVIVMLFSKMTVNFTKKGLLNISFKNCFTNQYINKNISLVCVVFLLLFSIINISTTTYANLTSIYSNYKSDSFITSNDGFSNADINEIELLDQVTEIYPIISRKVLFNDITPVNSYILHNPEELSSKLLNLQIKWMQNFDPSDFGSSANIILSDVYCRKYNLNYGQTVSISDGEVTKDFKIVGISYSLLENGDQVYISDYSLPFNNFEIVNLILIKSTNTENVLSDIDSMFLNKSIGTNIISDLLERDKAANSNIFLVFYSFEILCALISVIGIMNNIKMSYIQRKREFIILNTAGFRKRDLNFMKMLEVLCSTSIGCIFGLLLSYCASSSISSIMFNMNINI